MAKCVGPSLMQQRAWKQLCISADFFFLRSYTKNKEVPTVYTLTKYFGNGAKNS